MSRCCAQTEIVSGEGGDRVADAVVVEKWRSAARACRRGLETQAAPRKGYLLAAKATGRDRDSQ